MSHPCMVHYVASINSIVINTIPSIINPNINPKTFVINHQTHDTLMYRYHQQATTAWPYQIFSFHMSCHLIIHAIDSICCSHGRVVPFNTSNVHVRSHTRCSTSVGITRVVARQLLSLSSYPCQKNRKNWIWRSSGSKKILYVVQSGCAIVLKRVGVAQAADE